MKSLIYLILFLLTGNMAAQFACQDWKSAATAGLVGPSINNNAKSDTFDILHYHLELDFTTLPQRFLKGCAQLQITPKVAHNGRINIDLLELQVDSILQNGQALNYTHDDTIIAINLSANTSINDTFNLSIYYQGNPVGDGSGWGGWHHQNPYFFNLGVGFAADPHTYGRAWHPCFDNFVERATYDFEVLTVSPRKPYCNGLRVSENLVNGDTLLTKWSLSDAIPTYLASIAISNYTEIKDTVQGLQAVLPIEIMARPNDSVAALSAFSNLKGMFHSFEEAFGPYYWERIGYVMTTVGAMEHATSIHLPRTLLNPAGEDIIAHELAHHWWGNLVTCETDQDMWINEGMAEFCSHLYTEQVYSRERYLDVVRTNAYQVLSQAHRQDDGYKAIQGLDHEYVYGYHVYQKGAMVGHNLRGYLGDSLFFYGLTKLLENNMHSNLNSAQFRDQLASLTGVNLNDFFQNWVFLPGFPSIWADSTYFNANAASVRLRQGLHEAPSIYKNMPVDISFMGAQGQIETQRVILNGITDTYNFNNLNFTPVFAIANYEAKVLTGDTYDEYEPTGSFFDNFSKITLTPYSSIKSPKVVSVHHWTGPGGRTPNWADLRLSQSRFWTIGFSDISDQMKARVVINGSVNGMDGDLLANSGDSIVMLYRPLSGGEWQFWPYQSTTTFGSPGSIQGFIELDSIKPGDYVLANTSENIALSQVKHQFPFAIYPNPAKKYIMIETPADWQGEELVQIFDITGRTLYRAKHQLNNEALRLDTPEIEDDFVILQIGELSTKVSLK